MDTWEKVVIGIILVVLIFWLLPGTRQMIEKSKDAPKDWKGLLIPIAAVVLFIMFLISTL
jgi:hypothetical protein